MDNRASKNIRRAGSVARPYTAIFCAGALVMMMELSAGRIIAEQLGQSIYTWTSVIGVVLAGISLGNYIGGRVAARFTCARSLPVLFVFSSLACLLGPVVSNVLSDWKYLWEFSHPVQIVLHTVFAFLLPALCFGSITPVAAEMAIECRRSVGRTMGSVYAWGAAGSIVGTLMTGFFLVDMLGALGVFFAVAGTCTVLAFGYAPKKRLYAAWMIAALVLTAGIAGGAPGFTQLGRYLLLTKPLEENVLLYDQSQYSAIKVKSFDESGNVRAMYLDKMLHSKMDITHPTDLMYRYAWIYEAVLERQMGKTKPVTAFVIGGGAFTFPRYLALTRPGSTIDVAEIDPAVTEAARLACGYKPSPAIREHDYDARNFVSDMIARKKRGEPVPVYDCIFGDTFNDYSVPFHLTTKEFHDDLSSLMSDDAIYMLNMIDRFGRGRFLASILTTLRETFPVVKVLFCHRNIEFRGTYVVVCSKKEIDLLGIEESIRRRHPGFAGRLIADKEISELMGRTKAVFLTDDHAPVENLLAGIVREDRPDELSLHYQNKGLEAAKNGEMSDAIAYFQKAIEANGGNLEAFYNLGVAYMSEKNTAAALKSFELVLRSNPSHIPSRNNAAILLSQMGQAVAAENQLRIILQQEPGEVQARVNLAAVLVGLGRVEEARSELQRLIQMKPGYARAYSQLAELELAAGDAASARRLFRQALDIDPTLEQSRVGLAELE